MKNIPLSCHLGTHFNRKEGKDSVCMYCGFNYWEALKALNWKVQMAHMRISAAIEKDRQRKGIYD